MARRRRRSRRYNPNPRRRRSFRRRRYSRNPAGLRGLQIKDALIAVLGAAATKFIVARLPMALDPKLKAAATIGVGVGIGMVPVGSPSLRRQLSLGGQIAGVSMLLSEFMPGAFGYGDAGIADIVPVEATASLGAEDEYEALDTDAGDYEETLQGGGIA